MLTATHYDREYYEDHRRDGLDYLGHGAWQRDYARWLTDCLGWQGVPLLDVGCACGSIAAGLQAATQGRVVGVDLCEHMVQLGRQTWPHLELHTCDSINLHLWEAGSFGAIHSAQVAEHWRPDHVAMILEELRRVAEHGALFFGALDTEELYSRQSRDPATEDPTHICIRSRVWWCELGRVCGWEDVTAQYEPALRGHPMSYLSRYDWDWWVWRAA